MSVAVEQIKTFESVQLELPIPRDRYGNKATKLVLALGTWEPRLTIEDDLETFDKISKGSYVELTIRGYVEQAAESSKSTEDGEDSVELKKVLRISSIEVA